MSPLLQQGVGSSTVHLVPPPPLSLLGLFGQEGLKKNEKGGNLENKEEKVQRKGKLKVTRVQYGMQKEET
jgi:hypothetical protein